MNWRPLASIVLFLLVAQAFAAGVQVSALTTHQVWALRQASIAAGYHENNKPLEFSFTVTLQAILGQESSWCQDKHRMDPMSWGCGQLTLHTARLFDASATTKKLYHDDRYNIWLAATYLAYCRDRTPDWTQMVRCYKGRDTKGWKDYVNTIRRRIQDLPASED